MEPRLDWDNDYAQNSLGDIVYTRAARLATRQESNFFGSVESEVVSDAPSATAK